MSTLTQKAYLNAVETKLNDPITKRLMQFGSLSKDARRIRDEVGMRDARNLVMTSARNLFDATEGRDEVARTVQNFSATDAGYNTVADVKTLGAIDVTILYLCNSLVPYVCMDRALDTPDATIYYNNLIALNNVGGVQKGEVVMGNFSAPNLRVDLGSSVTLSGDTVPADGIEFGIKVIPGTVSVDLKDADGKVVAHGQDYASDGNIYFPVTAGVTKAEVNYETGKVSITATGANGFTAVAERDQTASNADDSILRVTPDYVPTQIHTEPKSIIVENNIQSKMYMKKISATAGSNRDMVEDAFSRTKNVMLEYTNVLVLSKIKAACTAPSSVLDFSDYDASKFASTKADMVQLFMGALKARFLARSGIEPTAIITGSYGVTLLSSIPGLWTKNPDVPSGPNGLAGYYDNMPVFRHNLINNGVSTIAEIYMVCKLPDNSSGSAIFGEFLPLTGTGAVSNFQVPMKIAEGYFCMNGVKIVSPNLIIKGLIKLPVSMFGASKL